MTPYFFKAKTDLRTKGQGLGVQVRRCERSQARLLLRPKDKLSLICHVLFKYSTVYYMNSQNDKRIVPYPTPVDQNIFKFSYSYFYIYVLSNNSIYHNCLGISQSFICMTRAFSDKLGLAVMRRSMLLDMI